jgi:hypothetical protein
MSYMAERLHRKHSSYKISMSLCLQDHISGILPEGKEAVGIGDIIEAIRRNRVRITDHADEEAQSDHFSFDEIFASVFQGEVIEDYPNDRPYPRCLVFGETFKGEPIHTAWAYNEENQWVVLIPVYRPDPQRWIEWRKRRP